MGFRTIVGESLEQGRRHRLRLTDTPEYTGNDSLVFDVVVHEDDRYPRPLYIPPFDSLTLTARRRISPTHCVVVRAIYRALGEGEDQYDRLVLSMVGVHPKVLNYSLEEHGVGGKSYIKVDEDQGYEGDLGLWDDSEFDFATTKDNQLVLPQGSPVKFAVSLDELDVVLAAQIDDHPIGEYPEDSEDRPLPPAPEVSMKSYDQNLRIPQTITYVF